MPLILFTVMWFIVEDFQANISLLILNCSVLREVDVHYNCKLIISEIWCQKSDIEVEINHNVVREDLSLKLPSFFRSAMLYLTNSKLRLIYLHRGFTIYNNTICKEGGLELYISIYNILLVAWVSIPTIISRNYLVGYMRMTPGPTARRITGTWKEGQQRSEMVPYSGSLSSNSSSSLNTQTTNKSDYLFRERQSPSKLFA